MKKTEQFTLPHIGIFQSLTSTELFNLCKYEQHLPDNSFILFVKKGWTIKNRPAIKKSELKARLMNALAGIKN